MLIARIFVSLNEPGVLEEKIGSVGQEPEIVREALK
jgi:hypothetical protein